MNSLRLVNEIRKFRQLPVLTVQRYMAVKVEPNSSSTSRQTPSGDETDREPIQFFGSQAATWRARNTRSGGADEYLWYQPYVITGSLTVFLLYFCVLREESDIDLKLEGSLFDHVQGLEEVQLTVAYKHNMENGLDNTAVIQRLKELGIDINLLNTK